MSTLYIADKKIGVPDEFDGIFIKHGATRTVQEPEKFVQAKGLEKFCFITPDGGEKVHALVDSGHIKLFKVFFKISEDAEAEEDEDETEPETSKPIGVKQGVDYETIVEAFKTNREVVQYVKQVTGEEINHRGRLDYIKKNALDVIYGRDSKTGD